MVVFNMYCLCYNATLKVFKIIWDYMYLSIPRKMTVKGSLAVIAIDIGSAFSGYAYQFRKDFEKARTKNIYSCFWTNGNQPYEKTASTILLNPDGSFNSFG